MQRPHQHDNMGRHPQGDGREYLGVFVENGRVADFINGPKYKSAFRTIVERTGCPVRVTPMQSILFIDLTPAQADEAIDILRAHGIKPIEELSHIRRWSMACVALPTCGLALTDSERVMPGIVDMLEDLFEEEGLADAELTVRMTGCPNGCARPYNADIGFVGRKPGVYNIHIGGGLSGDRIADLYAPDVRVEDFCDTLRPLLRAYREAREPGQSISDFYQQRMGRTSNRILITGDESPTSGLINLTISA
jgi:sulfite reductase beta subunit-like hemoprotein